MRLHTGQVWRESNREQTRVVVGCVDLVFDAVVLVNFKNEFDISPVF